MTTIESTDVAFAAETAAGRVAALEERVREGDAEVTPQEIDSARAAAESAARFARLREEALVRQTARQDAERKAAALERLTGEIETLRARYARLAAPDGDAVQRIRQTLLDFRHEATALDDETSSLIARLVNEAGISREVFGESVQPGPVRIDHLGRVVVDNVPVLFVSFHGTEMQRALREMVDGCLCDIGGA